MSDFANHIAAEAEKREAEQLYNYAQQRLENKTIVCRYAEIKSQCEPLNSIIEESGTPREQIIAACRYVVTGRID